MATVKKKRNKRRKLRTSQILDRMFDGRHRKPCAYCGKNILRSSATFDHIKPLSRGGYDKGKNGAIACAACNSKKGSMTVEQFRRVLATTPKDYLTEPGKV